MSGGAGNSSGAAAGSTGGGTGTFGTGGGLGGSSANGAVEGVSFGPTRIDFIGGELDVIDTSLCGYSIEGIVVCF